jgi:hypothetical protein
MPFPIAIYRLVMGQGWAEVGLGIIVNFGYYALWFWLLDRYDESLLYWFILVFGFALPFIVVFYAGG